MKLKIVSFEGVIELVAQGKNGNITIITDIIKQDRTLILNRLHIDGPGKGKSSLSELLSLARDFGQQNDVDEVIIYGAERTTGAKPGKTPKPIRIKVY
ncbi:MAG TPA: hypothetical protein EYP59_01775 [Thiotrichaceae bacterium]|nr:hypothetical protein [Thiotrichaceae bacterium]